MPAPRPLPHPFEDGTFRVAAALAAGINPERLHRSDLLAPFPGVRIPASAPPGILVRAAAYQHLRPDTFLSHATAAQIIGIPLPRRLQNGPVHAGVEHPNRAPRGFGVCGHALRPEHAKTRQFRGFTVSTPEEVWVQLAAYLNTEELVVVGDALIRHRFPLSTLPTLSASANRRGFRGRRTLLAALGQVRPGSASARETVLRLDLIRAGLPEPEINAEITEAGRFLAIGDLVFRDWKILVEYDGEQHRTEARQYHHDVDRLNELSAAGWLVIRVNKSHRGGRHRDVVTLVRRSLLDRGWWPG